jgi:hypothetical protein
MSLLICEFSSSMKLSSQFLRDHDPLGDWQVEIGDDDISFDCHFFGFTQLRVVVTEELRHPAAKLYQRHSLCVTFVA